MKPRGRWQGMLTIARFNWPFYLAALVVLIAAIIAGIAMPAPLWKYGTLLVAVGAFYFLFGSLAVSHWVYDRSDLYQWNWLQRVLAGISAQRMVFCHSGFDETSAMLREKLPGRDWVILDHYDALRMTEPSIRRARAMFPPVNGTLECAFDRWPLEDDSADMVLAMLAIHEFRTVDERAAWFSEAKRCLKSGGRLVLVEHTRDLANFLAFGPGFLHFHSVGSWRLSWQRAGMRLVEEFHITPFVRLFIIENHE